MSSVAAGFALLRRLQSSFVRSYRIQGVDGLNPMQEAERFLQSQMPTKLTREANLSRFYKGRKTFGHAETRNLTETKQARIESHMAPDIVIVAADPFAAAPIETVIAQKKEGFRFVSALFVAPLLIPVFFVGKMTIDTEARQRLSSYFTAERLSAKYGVPFKKGTTPLTSDIPESTLVAKVDVEDSGSLSILISGNKLESRVYNSRLDETPTPTEIATENFTQSDNSFISATVIPESKVLAHSSVVSLPPSSTESSGRFNSTEEAKGDEDENSTTQSITRVTAPTETKSIGDGASENTKELGDWTSASMVDVGDVKNNADDISTPNPNVLNPENLHQGTYISKSTAQTQKQELVDSLEQLRMNPPSKNASKNEIREWEAKKAFLKDALKRL